MQVLSPRTSSIQSSPSSSHLAATLTTVGENNEKIGNLSALHNDAQQCTIAHMGSSAQDGENEQYLS